LLKDGAIQLKHSKLFLCGLKEVGKSTLAKSLQNKCRSKNPKIETVESDARTAGFDYIQTTIPEAGADPWTIVDFAGHMEYYITHEMFLNAANGVFLIVFNVTQPEDVQIQQSMHWLKFINSRNSGDGDIAPHVVLVGSYCDQCNASILQELQESWSNRIRFLQCTFGTQLQVCDTVFFLDCRTADDVLKLLQMEVGQIRITMQKRNPIWIPRVVSEVSGTLPQLLKTLGCLVSVVDVFNTLQKTIKPTQDFSFDRSNVVLGS
jgi:GTPase SAR1 family protein